MSQSFESNPEGTGFKKETYISGGDADVKQAERRWSQGVCFEGQHGEPRCLREWEQWNEKSANKVVKTALKGPEKLSRNSEGR